MSIFLVLLSPRESLTPSGHGEKEKLGSRLYRQDGEVGGACVQARSARGKAEPWKAQSFPLPPADASALVL